MIDESKISFVDKCCRLECVVGALVSQVVSGELPEFLIHERCYTLERLFIAVSPCHE